MWLLTVGLCSATALIPRLRSWWQEGQKLKNYPWLHNKFKACLDYNIKKKTMGAQGSEEKEREEEKERYRMMAGIDSSRWGIHGRLAMYVASESWV